jgi:ABC-type branched-subunit amino acid transport system ATPase component/ABC-type branched-subunit amino acid transport system permease subunit
VTSVDVVSSRWVRPLAPYAPALAIVVLQLVAFPTGPGPWALGVVIGLLTALIALGLALVHRANRILNFAQGDLGTVPVTLSVGLVAITGLPYLVGAIMGLASAVALGALIEVVIIRRFFRAPRLLLTVATIGLSQLLVVCGLLLPRWWGRTIFAGERLPEPFHAHLEIGSVSFGGAEVLAVIVAPVLLGLLALFLRGTDLGVAVRASADRGDRAALLGVPVRRIQTVVWVVAAVLSFTGLFLTTGIFGFSGASTLSPQALVFALGALVLGRLDHLPAVAVSAVALRILEQGVLANNPSSPGRTYVVLAAVILAALVLRRAAARRGDLDTSSSWSAAEEVRPIPFELRKLGVVRLGRVGLPVALVAAAAALPLVLAPSQELKAATVAAFAIIALSVVVLTGWAGQVSLGQMSFVAVGGAVGAVATATWHVDLSLALIVAGLAGAVVAVIVGLPALRLPGLFLAITTLAFALASSNYLLNRKEQSWIPRDRLARPALFRTFDLASQGAMYEVALGVAVLAFLAVAGIRRSRTGRVLLAVRDNERGAAAYAIAPTRAKLTGFALSGFLAAVAGCLLVHINQAYSETPFVATESLGVFTAAVVGGLGSLWGAVLGALYLNGGTWFLPDRWRLLPSAVGVLAVLLVLPGGLANVAYRGRDALLRHLARRRGIGVAGRADVVAASTALGWTAAAASIHGPDLTIADDNAAIDDDAADDVAAAEVRTGAADGARIAEARDEGQPVLLTVRDVEVAYGDVQVLFGVDLDVVEGEILALLGTNGAGKSTLLKAISGVAPARFGTVMFDGGEITHLAPEKIAGLGISQMPGGQGVFPALTVAENLRTAAWLLRHDRAERAKRTEQALGRFPVLRERLGHPAADLSGGQQQMLALAMALLARPRLLLIDELSLGLAPVVVEQLLTVVRELRDEGTTIVLVEQSVNVALTVADTAYFMEKGEIRFHGPTAELLERPDVLRSVFLQGAASRLEPNVAVPQVTLAGNHEVAALDARGISVSFGGIAAVQDVTLAVRPGEVVGLIGPNGAGKTTLVDLISGYLRPDHGTISIDGRNVTGLRPHRRMAIGLGRSFQDSRLFPSLTVEETLLVALDRWLDVRDPLNAAFRLPPFVDSEHAARHRVEELIDLLGLAAFRSTFVGELSTGSRRVVDLGCVLAHAPSLVLLDEPSSGIAQREAEALGPLLLRIRDALGASLVVIEHDMALISQISDRLVALDQGRVVTSGSPAEVLAHPEVISSYLGGNVAVLRRSGATPTVEREQP